MTYVSSIIQRKTTVVVELIVSHIAPGHIAPSMFVENSFFNKLEKRVVMKTIRIVHISQNILLKKKNKNGLTSAMESSQNQI